MKNKIWKPKHLYDIDVCAICFFAVVFNDYTKATEEDIAYLHKGLDEYFERGCSLEAGEYEYIYKGKGTTEYRIPMYSSDKPCQCCGNAARGVRYPLAVVKYSWEEVES